MRWLALAVAALACAWFAIGIRQAHDTNAAGAIIGASGPLSHAQAAHAASLLDGAATLNPDIGVEILRSQLALREHRVARAVAIARRATREEPLNVRTWLALAQANFARGRNDYRALAKMTKLDPGLLRERR